MSWGFIVLRFFEVASSTTRYEEKENAMPLLFGVLIPVLNFLIMGIQGRPGFARRS